jgi:hypothetical protein
MDSIIMRMWSPWLCKINIGHTKSNCLASRGCTNFNHLASTSVAHKLVFCLQNALKLTYEHLQFLTFSQGYNPRTSIKGDAWDGKGFATEGEIRDRWRQIGDTGGNGKEEEGKGGVNGEGHRFGKEGEGRLSSPNKQKSCIRAC